MLSMSKKLPVYNAMTEKCDDIKPKWSPGGVPSTIYPVPVVCYVKIIIQFMDAILWKL